MNTLSNFITKTHMNRLQTEVSLLRGKTIISENRKGETVAIRKCSKGYRVIVEAKSTKMDMIFKTPEAAIAFAGIQF